jgi:hypothetical protein
MKTNIMEIMIAVITTSIGAAATIGGALTKYFYHKRNQKKKALKYKTKKFEELHHKIIEIINNINFTDTINTAFYLSNFVFCINQTIEENYDLYDFLTVYQKENLFAMFKQIDNLICHPEYLAFNKVAIKDTNLNNYLEFTKEFDNVKTIIFPKLDNSPFILSTFDAISDLFKDIKKEFSKVKIDKEKIKTLDSHKENMRNAVLVIEKSFIRYKQKKELKTT